MTASATATVQVQFELDSVSPRLLGAATWAPLTLELFDPAAPAELVAAIEISTAGLAPHETVILLALSLHRY